MRALSITLLLTYLLIAVPLTVQSRAHRLQQRGLIQPRPKGGTYPRQKALVRQDSPPVPATTPAPLRPPQLNGRTFSSGPCGSRRP
jgi:hypothetical protein